MIQRIQSAYLLLGCLSVSAPLYFREWIKFVGGGNPMVDQGIQIVAGAAALIGFAVIFMHNNRDRQYQITLLVQVLTLIVFISILSIHFLRDRLPGTTDVGFEPITIAVILLPCLAYVFFFLARRAIHKDMKLIKSMDRIR